MQCLACGKQIWQKVSQFSSKFGVLIVGEMKSRFFDKRQFFVCQKKFGEIDPLSNSAVNDARVTTRFFFDGGKFILITSCLPLIYVLPVVPSFFAPTIG